MKECSKIKVQNYSRAELARSSFTCRGQVFVIVGRSLCLALRLFEVDIFKTLLELGENVSTKF